MENGLNTRQKSFAKHIVAGNNGTKAAILAGYSKRSARFTASRLLTNHNVCQQIEEVFEQAGLSDEQLVDRLKTAIDAGIGQKANNSDALKGLKLAFELKGRLDQRVEVETSQESELRMQLSDMSNEELMNYLDSITKKTQEYVARIKGRRQHKINGDDAKVALPDKKVENIEEISLASDVEVPIIEARPHKAVGTPIESKPIIQPIRKFVVETNHSEDDKYYPKISYPG